MPASAQAPTTAPLFLGLQSYTEAQAASFFGRDEEINRLTNLIKANTLTIVFGKSGTGKTSLLNAGVFPRLRKDYCLPFRIRLEFADDSPDLVSQIKKTLREEIDKYGFKVESYPGAETLWEYFHREQLWRSVTPILIFDQFEEIFTLAKRSSRFGKTELDAFWQELSNLIENAIPEEIKDRFLDGTENLDFAYKVQKVKALFSFREEFLPEFESITMRIPSLKYSRFRLLPLNGNQAYEVLTKTWKENINAAEADKIVQFFSTEESGHQAYELMMIEPSLLSQVCSLIERERLQKGKGKISAEFLENYSRTFVMRSIYDEAMNESNAAVAKTVGLLLSAKPVNEFVEDKLITDEGYRIRYAMLENDAPLKPGVDVLKAKYFVRGEGRSIELTHDVLTPLIKRDREERRKELALAKARKKARQRVIFITAVALLAAVGFWLLTAQKAIQAKKDALLDRDDAIDQATAAYQQLGNLQVSLKKVDSTLKLKKDSLRKAVPGRYSDSALYESLQQRSQSDSIRLVSLNEQVNKQKKEAESRDSVNRAQLSDLSLTKKKLDSAARSARQEIVLLQRRLATDSSRLTWMQTKYEELDKTYQNILTETADVVRTPNQNIPFDAAADTASLKLNLYYGGANAAKVPGNLRIYLIPFTATNRNIISAAQTYEIRCDEMNLDRAKGNKLARYVNGTYIFLNVPQGKYFIKICTYYGGFYTYTKASNGNVTVKLDASPPIR